MNNIFQPGTIGAVMACPPLIGNIFSFTTLLFTSMVSNKEDRHKFIIDYKYTVRSIAFGKFLIGGAMIGYSLKDGDFSYKGEDQKCFKGPLEVPCFDSDKAQNCMLGEFIMIDAMLDLLLKSSLSDMIMLDYS